MTAWHGGITDDEYDEINRQAIKSRPVNGKIKDALSTARYVLRYEPFKNDPFYRSEKEGQIILHPPAVDPNGASMWRNIPAVARGPVEGHAAQYSGTYAQVAAHAERLNKLELAKTGGPTHLFSVDVMPKEAA